MSNLKIVTLSEEFNWIITPAGNPKINDDDRTRSIKGKRVAIESNKEEYNSNNSEEEDEEEIEDFDIEGSDNFISILQK